MKLFDPPRLTGKYLRETLSSGWLTSGPRCEELREKVGAFLNVPTKRVVLAASATAGFQAVLDMLSNRNTNWTALGEDPWYGQVKITRATWPGMLQAIDHADAMERASDQRRRCDIVVLTDIGGRRFIDPVQAASVTGLGVAWADAIGAAVYIHDSCHSWMPDPAADFGLSSFYPTKLVPGAEGGVVICKREEDADELRDWLYCGLQPGRAGDGCDPSVQGRKANMTDVAAALNLEALELAPGYMWAIRDRWRFMASLAEERGIPYRDQPVRPYLFQIDAKVVSSYELVPDNVPWVRTKLKERGIPTAWNFKPSTLVTVPCYPGQKLSEMLYIMDCVQRIL